MEELYRQLEAGFSESVSRIPLPQREWALRYRMAPFASDPRLHLGTKRKIGGLYVVSMKPYAVARRHYSFGWEERATRPDLHRWYDSEHAAGNFVREANDLLLRTLAHMEDDTPAREVFNTYATFWRAEDAKQLKAFGLENIDCGSYHASFLARLQPQVVLCIGNGPEPSAFALMKRLHAHGGDSRYRSIQSRPEGANQVFSYQESTRDRCAALELHAYGNAVAHGATSSSAGRVRRVTACPSA